MEGLRRNFFNGIQKGDMKIAWVKWSRVLEPKTHGGLGVSRFFALNRALLAKWVWRFLSHDNSLWYRVISGIHGSNAQFSAAHSSLWKSIINSTNSLKEQGMDILSHFKIRIDISVAEKLNGSLLSSFRRGVRGGTETHQYELLSSLIEPVILSNSDDRWVCDLNGQGVFCVKDIRFLIEKSFLPYSGTPTRWVKSVPIKINVFAWKNNKRFSPTPDGTFDLQNTPSATQEPQRINFAQPQLVYPNQPYDHQAYNNPSFAPPQQQNAFHPYGQPNMYGHYDFGSHHNIGESSSQPNVGGSSSQSNVGGSLLPIQVSVRQKKPNRRRQTAPKKNPQKEKAVDQRCIPWTPEEETALCKGSIHMSEDSVKDNARKERRFWIEILNILTYTNGAGDADYLQRALIDYQAEYGVPFTLLHCWERRVQHSKEPRNVRVIEDQKAGVGTQSCGVENLTYGEPSKRRSVI
nr:RNA-directed DNA polymerase, eukaryota, reverse transcriptase zinc-binding domain protein [Tanacetum cinerariifolium]